MPQTLIRIFDTFSHAEIARNALLHAGFSLDAMQLVSTDDEAGPVQGHFYIGNGNHKDPSYHGNFAKPVNRASFMLTLDTGDESHYLQAADLLERVAPDPDDENPGRNVYYE